VSGAEGRRPAPWPSSRGQAVLAVLALALAAGASTAGSWVRAVGTSALSGSVPLAVSGASAAPVVPATALVIAAAGAAIALAGRAGRWVVVAVVGLGGLGVAAAAVAVLADPVSRAEAAARAQTGVGDVSGPVTTTAGPWVALVVGLVGIAVAVLLARSSSRWSAPSRRHEVAAAATPAAGLAPDERADWDALTDGTDPSAGPGAGA
jgi:hypothetical protein